MTDFFPLLLALFIIVVTFLTAMNHGIVKLLASGLSALVLLLVLGGGIAFLPEIAKRSLDIDLTWKATFGLSCIIAILAFTISRILFGWVFRKLFGTEGSLHHLSDGVVGGVISLIPSLIIVLFLFLCTRIGGTVLELNHIATLSQNEVTNTITSLPGYPVAAKWRNSIDRLPVVPGVLDAIDPISNRGNRNMAAFVMVGQSKALRKYLSEQSETADLVESQMLAKLGEAESVQKALKSQERVALITLSEIRAAAENAIEQKTLREFEWQPFLEGFVVSIEENAPASLKKEREQN